MTWHRLASAFAVRPSRRQVSSRTRIALREPLNGTASQSGASRIKIIASSPNQPGLNRRQDRRQAKGCIGMQSLQQNKTQQSPTPTL
jgi:hypothetical protein